MKTEWVLEDLIWIIRLSRVKVSYCIVYFIIVLNIFTFLCTRHKITWYYIPLKIYSCKCLCIWTLIIWKLAHWSKGFLVAILMGSLPIVHLCHACCVFENFLCPVFRSAHLVLPLVLWTTRRITHREQYSNHHNTLQVNMLCIISSVASETTSIHLF